MSDNTNSTIKIKNKILAMLAAPAAIPPKPKIAATIATIKKVIVQRNMIKSLSLDKLFVVSVNNEKAVPSFKPGVLNPIR